MMGEESGGEQAMAFTKVATIHELGPGRAKQARVGSRTLAIFNIGGTFYAVDDTCPHRGAPLWEGDVSGTEVTCPWHGARFDVTTGAHLCPPARSGVTCYPVRVVGDEVQADVP
jgi:nitrite reductase/ring-hydroxylating ferredoxin subunit